MPVTAGQACALCADQVPVGRCAQNSQSSGRDRGATQQQGIFGAGCCLWVRPAITGGSLQTTAPPPPPLRRRRQCRNRPGAALHGKGGHYTVEELQTREVIRIARQPSGRRRRRGRRAGLSRTARLTKRQGRNYRPKAVIQLVGAVKLTTRPVMEWEIRAERAPGRSHNDTHAAGRHRCV